MGILAVIRAQVVAEAERGPFVTFAGLPLASRSTSWRGMETSQSGVEAGGSGSQPWHESDSWMLCGPDSQPHFQLPSHFLWKPMLKGMGGGWLTTLGFPFLSKPAQMILALSCLDRMLVSQPLTFLLPGP